MESTFSWMAMPEAELKALENRGDGLKPARTQGLEYTQFRRRKSFLQRFSSLQQMLWNQRRRLSSPGAHLSQV
jgi:hypothetical protein